LIIIITGIIDDAKGVTAKQKFAAQFFSACVIIFFTDILYTSLLFDVFGNFSHIISILITFIWIIGVTNAVNLMDGMDGLASGISFMSFGALAISAYNQEKILLFYICLVLMGSILGFLKYNLPPAKVFMGDTGSLFLGFNLAILSLDVSHKSSTILSLLIPAMFVSIPILDTVLAIFRRTKRGQNPFHPDKEHLHHKILDLGFSSSQALVIFYTLSVVLGLLALSITQQRITFILILTALMLYAFLLMIDVARNYDLFVFFKKIINEYKNNIKVKSLDYKFIKWGLSGYTKFLIFMAILSVFSCKEILITNIVIPAIISAIIFTDKFLNKENNDFYLYPLFFVFLYLSFGASSLINYYIFLILIQILWIIVLLKLYETGFLPLFVHPVELLIFFTLIVICRTHIPSYVSLKLSIIMATGLYYLWKTEILKNKFIQQYY
jgi:UDP-GlcNAc:undecaprenyl-phosphate GlcNAc-1-phosphate transferase